MAERADAPHREPGSAPSALPVGAVLGRYRLGAVVGEPSPHAILYRARGAAEEILVVKELFPGALVTRAPGSAAVQPRDADAEARMAEARRRFLLEAQLLRSVEDPALPRVRDHLEANGTAYLVTEYVRGHTLLERRTAGKPMPVAEARGIVTALLGALEALHAQGILHRDVAPANVLVGADHRARLLGLATPRQLLMDGTSGATPPRAGFAPIEMYGSRGKGPWTDVYGVAALLYFLLTGTEPPSAVDRAAGAALVPASRLVAGLPWALDALLAKALSQKPDERPHSAERLRALLDEALGDERRLAGSHAPGRAPLALATTPPHDHPAAPALPAAFGSSLRQLAEHEVTVGDAPGEVLTVGGSGVAVVLPSAREAVATPRGGRRPLVLASAGVLVLASVVGGVMAWRSHRERERERAALLAFPVTQAGRPAAAATPPAAVPPAAAEVSAAPVESVPVVAPPAAPTKGPQPDTSRRTAGGTRPVVMPPSPQPVAPRAVAELAPPPARTRQRGDERTKGRTRTPPQPAGPPLPADALARLERGLADARQRADRGQYSIAQRLLRLTAAEASRLAAGHPGSPELAAFRARLDDERQRTSEACEGYNLLQRRREAPQVDCG